MAAGPGTVAAFIAEPIVGATLAAAVPPEGYWEAITDVLRRHGVLLITDEVMTGFGRTGRWFGGDHWDVRPDLLVAAKGASSGYWPLGFVAAAGHVAEALAAPGSFVHGFTYSHHPVGAAVAGEVLRILVDGGPGRGQRAQGRATAGVAGRRGWVRIPTWARSAAGACSRAWSWSRTVTRGCRSRARRRVTERVVAAARAAGVLLYSGTGNANGTDGDQLLLGPPFVVTDAELERIVDVLGNAIESTLDQLAGAPGHRRPAVPSRRRASPSRWSPTDEATARRPPVAPIHPRTM